MDQRKSLQHRKLYLAITGQRGSVSCVNNIVNIYEESEQANEQTPGRGNYNDNCKHGRVLFRAQAR